MSKILKTELKSVMLADLKPYANNPRNNDAAVEFVANSLQEFGLVKNSIVVDENMVLLTGHTTLKAMQKLGWESAPEVTKVCGLSDEQKKAYRIADNKTGEKALWNKELLLKETLELKTIDLKKFGFDDLPQSAESTAKDKGASEPPKIPTTQCGDIFRLGNHVLMCGDSTNLGDVERLMQGEKADMTFTSPPYNIGESSRLNSVRHSKDNKYLEYRDDTPEWLSLMNKSTSNALNNSRFVFVNVQMVSNNKKMLVEWLSKYKDELCDIAIWYKNNAAPAMAHKVMNSNFEFVFILSNESQTRVIGSHDFRGCVSNVFQSPNNSRNEFSDIHQAVFPIKLPLYFIENFSNEHEIILDLFGGCGTTLIACEQTNRKCRMMELAPEYCDVIIKRWEDMTGRSAEKIN